MALHFFYGLRHQRNLRFFLLLIVCTWWSVCLPAYAEEITVSGESLWSVQDGQNLTVASLLKTLGQADIVLLGEIHDNPHHHVLRGQLLSDATMAKRSLIAEQMNAGQKASDNPDLLSSLEQAGFDADGWQWPLHERVFSTAREAGLDVYGGNITAPQTREIFKSKGNQLPEGLGALLQKAALGEDALKQLRYEIDEGHCGAMPASMFDGMLAVQRARDASMAAELLKHLPSVLIAGNGHVWKHLGVPQIIRANRPELHTVSVLFLEHAVFADDAERIEWLESFRGIADFVWVTPAQQRPDPCLSLRKK
jgi:uncharacterized iron-regulated protein